ncbi:HK97-gp10 family putative phage morphogenesis protein [Arthrobacter sp. OY3WO11]|uniref:HK97-gp10 family putative phage morphogenesis protein n=1 Tax=Arthrobacter sp. OY3WO11 TaxID=1835723 RepID=UPI0007CF195A|nr:HK97-gp10 family putative phage morphogenesis protein [Arthrobacter sp. OY3WO11]OAE01861.1 hypothetical protein A6A22_10865 [Arthrobacter sp. OY3WO11]
MARTIEIEVKGFSELEALFAKAPQRTRAQVAKALEYSAILIQRNARQEAPIDKGQLRSSIGITRLANAVVIRPGVKYALYVHEGTGLYGPKRAMIRPGRVMAWRGRGGAVFARSSRGQRPNQFMDRAANSSRAGINDAFDQAIKNIIGGK